MTPAEELQARLDWANAVIRAWHANDEAARQAAQEEADRLMARIEANEDAKGRGEHPARGPLGGGEKRVPGRF